MIRNATFSDIPAITALLEATHRKSKYNGRAVLDPKAVEQLLMAMVMGQNKTDGDATYLVVCVKDGGAKDQVVGFMAGALSRVYNILNKYCASDIFLINEGGTGPDLLRMVDGYIKWAMANQKVIEIGLSWSDAVSGGHKLATLYKHYGFRLVGEQYEYRTDMEMEAAA